MSVIINDIWKIITETIASARKEKRPTAVREAVRCSLLIMVCHKDLLRSFISIATPTQVKANIQKRELLVMENSQKYLIFNK